MLSLMFASTELVWLNLNRPTHSIILSALTVLNRSLIIPNSKDNNQLTSSDIAPREVQGVLVRDLGVTSKWFCDCGLTLNLDKCKLLVLPKRKSDQ